MAHKVIDQVLSGDMDVGVTFNPPDTPSLRLERTMIYRLGLAVAPDHPLADRTEISFSECVSYPMIIPDEIYPCGESWSGHGVDTSAEHCEVC
jgi:DNA-binding transcriptional LysR family regulator